MYNCPRVNIVSFDVANKPTFSKLCPRDLLPVMANANLTESIVCFSTNGISVPSINLGILTILHFSCPDKNSNCNISLQMNINSNSVGQQPMRDRAYCAHSSIQDPWVLRCMSRCPDQVVSLKRDPFIDPLQVG
ncbi:hypothetical protein TNCV_63141 [Trichonephila clavipes]|nr:hypothetical protein TNCV_63141 [Trichonephila clavipes]